MVQSAAVLSVQNSVKSGLRSKKQTLKKNKKRMIVSDMILPSEILEEILSRLPVKALLQFRCVSETWRSIISTPLLISLQLNQWRQNHKNHKLILTSSYCMHLFDSEAPYNYNKVAEISHPNIDTLYEIDIWGSCDGIVCLTHSVNKLCLWNPGTRAYKEIPDAENPCPRQQCNVEVIYGFGYNGREKDYEIIQVMSYRNYGEDFAHQSRFRIYSLATNSWGRMEEMGPYVIVIASEEMGELVEDILHWVGKKCGNSQHKPNLVIAYEIENRKFREVALWNHENQNMLMIHVAVLHGCLSLLCEYSRVVEGWVMEEYDVKESWTKVFTISEQLVYDMLVPNIPLCFVLKCGKLMRNVKIRDLFLGKIGGLMAKNLVEQYSPTAAHIESLVTP